MTLYRAMQFAFLVFAYFLLGPKDVRATTCEEECYNHLEIFCPDSEVWNYSCRNGVLTECWASDPACS